MEKEWLQKLREEFENLYSNGRYEEMVALFEKMLDYLEMVNDTTEEEEKKFKIINFELPLKPISVNALTRIGINKKTGKRFAFKSDEYRKFQETALMMLPNKEGFGKQQLGVDLIFGLKQPLRVDIDNLSKAMLDVLQQKGYIQDDRYVFRLLLEKEPAIDDYIRGSIFEL